jgi:hypothetical protein
VRWSFHRLKRQRLAENVRGLFYQIESLQLQRLSMDFKAECIVLYKVWEDWGRLYYLNPAESFYFYFFKGGGGREIRTEDVASPGVLNYECSIMFHVHAPSMLA